MSQDFCAPDCALTEALGHLRPALARRARAILRTHEDVEDVVQEAAARAWRARSSLRCGTDPAPWLNKIVTHVALDHVRKERRRSATAEPDLPQTGPRSPVEEQLLQSEALSAVRTAAAGLAQPHKRVLVMHDFIGLSSHEIARMERIPYHTVRTRLRRARLSVRDRIAGASA